MTSFQFDAIVLAGGRSSRLQGGGDKALLVYNGRSLIERAVAAVEAAQTIVSVGPIDVPGTVKAIEEPRFAGPAAALAAGLTKLDEPAEWIVALACDLPFASRAVESLLAAMPVASDGVVAVDETGRRQPLLAIYRSSALSAVIADSEVDGLALHSLISRLDLTELPLDDHLTTDIDSRADAAALGIQVHGPAC